MLGKRRKEASPQAMGLLPPSLTASTKRLFGPLRQMEKKVFQAGRISKAHTQTPALCQRSRPPTVAKDYQPPGTTGLPCWAKPRGQPSSRRTTASKPCLVLPAGPRAQERSCQVRRAAAGLNTHPPSSTFSIPHRGPDSPAQLPLPSPLSRGRGPVPDFYSLGAKFSLLKGRIRAQLTLATSLSLLWLSREITAACRRVA